MNINKGTKLMIVTCDNSETWQDEYILTESVATRNFEVTVALNKELYHAQEVLVSNFGWTRTQAETIRFYHYKDIQNPGTYFGVFVSVFDV